jgi:hypothetical protein
MWRYGWFTQTEAAMIDFLFTAGQWLAMLAFLFGACLVITCAAEEAGNAPGRFSQTTTHDWDAPGRGLENRRQRDS